MNTKQTQQKKIEEFRKMFPVATSEASLLDGNLDPDLGEEIEKFIAQALADQRQGYVEGLEKMKNNEIYHEIIYKVGQKCQNRTLDKAIKLIEQGEEPTR